jgi:hypothetical protein
VRKNSRHVRLERPFVLAETGVPPRTEQRHLSVGAQLGRKFREIGREPLDDRNHGAAHIRLVPIAIGVKPGAVVMAFECAKE